MDLDIDLGAYCSHVEHYLFRRNGGHMIKITGPRFDLVCEWAKRGIPVKVVERGIDRCCERHERKPRRRPIPIEFCEADVLDVFDEWRRAVGVPVRDVVSEDAEESGSEDESPHRRHASLPAHLDRVIARLTTLRGGEDRSLDETFEQIVRELDAARAAAKTLRGEARAAFLQRLQALDSTIISAVRSSCDASTLEQLEREADAELAPFRERMPAEAYEQSRRAAVDRLIRDRRRLPVIAFE